MICIGNDYSPKRKITIKCKKCQASTTNAAIRNDMSWLKKVSIDKWNTRAISTHEKEQLRRLKAFVNDIHKYYMVRSDGAAKYYLNILTNMG